MNNFPLYNSLITNIPTKDLSVKQKEEFIKKVQNIDSKGRDLIFALIQFYRIENNNKDIKNIIPYNGVSEVTKENTENLTWSLGDFPIKLRNILYKFIVMHMQTMEDDAKRNNVINK